MESYNNVPVAKNTEIIADQNSISVIEPSTKRLLKIGYLKGGYSHATMCICLTDLLDALGYYNALKQISTIDKLKTLPRITCKIRTQNNGIRHVRCIQVSALEDYLLFLTIRSTSLHVKDIANGMLKTLNTLLNIIYKQHDIVAEILADKIAAKVKNDAIKKQARIKGNQMLNESAIHKVTLAETKHRKRRLVRNLTN